MKIEIITSMYNEEFLLPFFLKHYAWVDRINVIYDEDSTDNTLNILKATKNVNILPFSFPNLKDEDLRIKKTNSVYMKLHECDWVLLPDADEFIFIKRSDFNKINSSVVSAKLFNIYRHITEKDLNIGKPIREQRRHGVFEKLYNKPIIVKSGLNIEWTPGLHNIVTGIGVVRKIKKSGVFKKIKRKTNFLINNSIINDYGIIGAHWSNADVSFCVDRRIKAGRDRQSKVNLKKKYGIQNHGIVEEDVLNECREHQNDPMVF